MSHTSHSQGEAEVAGNGEQTQKQNVAQCRQFKCLFEADADVLAATRAGKTSLDIAQKYNKQDAVKE